MESNFRSPLSHVGNVDAATLIFVGTEDQRVDPATQGIPFYKALKSQERASVTLYHYPGMNEEKLPFFACSMRKKYVKANNLG